MKTWKTLEIQIPGKRTLSFSVTLDLRSWMLGFEFDEHEVSFYFGPLSIDSWIFAQRSTLVKYPHLSTRDYDVFVVDEFETGIERTPEQKKSLTDWFERMQRAQAKYRSFFTHYSDDYKRELITIENGHSASCIDHQDGCCHCLKGFSPDLNRTVVDLRAEEQKKHWLANNWSKIPESMIADATKFIQHKSDYQI